MDRCTWVLYAYVSSWAKMSSYPGVSRRHAISSRPVVFCISRLSVGLKMVHRGRHVLQFAESAKRPEEPSHNLRAFVCPEKFQYVTRYNSMIEKQGCRKRSRRL